MTTRRPLVLVSGSPQELPSGDDVAAGPTVLRFVKADGTETWLPSSVGEGTTIVEASPSKSFFMAGW